MKNNTFRKVSAALVALAAVISTAPAAFAQAAYVKTFDLPTKPTTDGTFKGVDPTGAQLQMWVNFTGATETSYNALVTQFNSTNPWKITVTGTAKGAYPDVYNAVLGAIQTKSLPNISVAYQNQAATYQTANVVLPLDSYVNDPVYGLGDAGKAEFLPGILDADLNPQFNNARLGFPLYRSAEAIYYNVDALKNLGYDTFPKTWDDLKKVSLAYYKATGNVAYEVRTDASWVAAAAFAQGGNIFDAKSGKFTYDSAEAQVGPAAMADLLNQGAVGLISNASGFSDEADFGTGKTLFYGSSTSGLNYILKAITDGKGNFSVGVAPLPYTGNQPTMDLYGASWSVFATGTPAQQLASWLFIRWFSEAEQQAPWVQASGYFSIRTSTAPLLADYFAKNPVYKAASDLLKNTKAEPPIAGYDPIRTEAGKAFNDVLDGQPVKTRFAALNAFANTTLASFKPNLVPPTPKPPKPTAAATMSGTMAPVMAATMVATMAPTMSATMAPTMAATMSATMAPTMAATTAK